MYHDVLEASLRLPRHPFFVSVLNEFEIGLGQVAPNAWRLLTFFLVLTLHARVNLFVELFHVFFQMLLYPGGNSWFYFRAKANRSLVFNPVTSIKDWKFKYAFVKVKGVNKSWNFGPHTPPVDFEKIAKRLSAEVAALEALGVVQAPALLSNKCQATVGIVTYGRSSLLILFTICLCGV